MYHVFDVPDLSSGLSFVQIVRLTLVHSFLGFLGSESWLRLNEYQVDYPVYYISWAFSCQINQCLIPSSLRFC